MQHIVTTSQKNKKRKFSQIVIFAIAIVIIGIAIVAINRFSEPSLPLSATGIAGKQLTEAEVITPESTKKPITHSGVVNTESESIQETAVETAQVVPNSVAATSKTNYVGAFEKSPMEVTRNGAEQILMLLMMANPDVETPPMPSMSEAQLLAEFKSSFTNDIVIYDDDPPEVVARKEMLHNGLMQVYDIVENGGSIREAIAELASYNAEGVALRQKVMQEYRRIEKEEGIEAAKEYLADANDELVANDVQPVVMLSKDERRALHRQRSKEKREMRKRKMEEALMQNAR